MHKKVLIFVCSPYRGNIEANTAYAIRACKYVVKCGYIPIAPHLYFTRFLDDSDSYERNSGLEAGLELLSRCAGIWVFGEKVTEGMEKEISYAKRSNRLTSIKYVTDKELDELVAK